MAKVVLDLCGGTGAWSKPYADKGYDVKLITLPNYDVTKAELQGRSVIFHSENPSAAPTLEVKYTHVKGVLAAPPCTEFSLANTRQTYALRPDWRTGLVAVQACERIIRECMCAGWTDWWALEKPVRASQETPRSTSAYVRGMVVRSGRPLRKAYRLMGLLQTSEKASVR